MTTRPNAGIPNAPLPEIWSRFQETSPLLSPANRAKRTILVVGTGLAGSSAAATLAEQGYRVKVFCLQDSPRRAHSVAAQGGINAAKNYKNDGDSVFRLFHDTIKGGDFRAREANVYRLAQLSNAIIDHCVAQGIPFTREYGGYLANRSFGGAQVSRTFYTKGQTGQQLLLGSYGALLRQTAGGRLSLHPRTEMLDLVVVDNRVRGIVVRHLLSGQVEAHAGDAVVLATGGYANLYCLSTNARSGNVTALWRAYRRGAWFANPCFVQIHPTCLPAQGSQQSKLTLMSESLRNDGRVWVPKAAGDRRRAPDIPEDARDYFLEARYPAFGNLVPRDVASRQIKEQCDLGLGIDGGRTVYLDLEDAIRAQGLTAILRKYGNLLDMYQRLTGDDPANEPMRIYPAAHYSMGGLWVDYSLMSNLSGLFVLGEANFSDHGANRLGASALMQGLADGYFILPNTLGPYLAQAGPNPIDARHDSFRSSQEEVNAQLGRLLRIRGSRTAADLHRELGLMLWDHCGIVRSEAGLRAALAKLPRLREEFWGNLMVPGVGVDLNQALELAGRVADFLECGELVVQDALHRRESCGCHLREESRTEDHEPRRRDEEYAYVAAWEYRGQGQAPGLHREPLAFTLVTTGQRSYR